MKRQATIQLDEPARRRRKTTNQIPREINVKTKIQLHKTIYWLDQVRKAYADCNDVDLARILHTTKQAIGKQKMGETQMSVEQAVRVAQILDISPFVVICGVSGWPDRDEKFWTAALTDYQLRQ